MRKKYILLSLIILVILLSLFLFLPTTSKKSPKSPASKTITASGNSTFTRTQNTVYLSLQPEKEYLYKTQGKGLQAAEEFIDTPPLFNNAPLIPTDFKKNSILQKTMEDASDPVAREANPAISSEHYVYGQKIHDIPVYHAELAIHLRNGNEIYFVEGNLVENEAIDTPKISQEQALQRALEAAKRQSPGSEPVVESAKQVILNKKILGEDEDEKNYLTLAVTVQSTSETSLSFKKRYFVDLTTGTVIYEEKLTHEALNRVVKDCRNGGCKAGRNEGQPAKGGAIDTIYDLMGTYYNFLQTNFRRDGLDGRGGQMIASIVPPCKNAQANENGVKVCSDMVALDVINHELTHTLVGKIKDIGSGILSNTFHEGNADVFAMTIGPDYILNSNIDVARNAQNPAAENQPDSLFSPRYKCPEDDHENSTVISHAFYLMAEGGTLNNCSVTRLGKATAIRIQYQAVVKYLTSSTNYRTYFTAMTNACNDLYQNTSSTCRQVKAALVAAQLDQQPANSQKGAKCAGRKAQPIQCPAAFAQSPTPAAQTTPTVNPTFTCLGSCPTTEPTTMNAMVPTETVIAPATDTSTNPVADTGTAPGVDTSMPADTSGTDVSGNNGGVCRPRKKLKKKKKERKRLKKKLKKAQKNGKTKKAKKLKKKLKKLNKQIKKQKKKVNNQC